MKASSLGGPKPQFVDANGNPYSGAKLFFYAAGSSTKQNTYRDSTGVTPNTNPIVLDSSGRPTYEIWFTDGLTYKAVLAPSTDTDPPNSPIFTVDNLPGINDVTASVDEWQASGLTPTYVGATSFTVSGDQTATFTAGRRLKSSNTAGTIYSSITSSSYNAGTGLTTVTVTNDSGTLDSGLSAVFTSILRSSASSLPYVRFPSANVVSVVTAGTERLRVNATGYIGVAMTTMTGSAGDGVGVELGPAGYAQLIRNQNPAMFLGRTVSTGNAMTIAYGATDTTAGEVGSISVTAVATAFNTSSDARLKIKNGPAQYDPQWIHNVAASIYDVTWKVNGYRQNTFVAQDLYQAEPDAVKAGDDGETVTEQWAVDPSKLVAKLILEVENLRTEFDAYKASHP